jgi:hypothetical protein
MDILSAMQIAQEDLNKTFELILEHKYYELLDSKNTQEALQVIRCEIPQVCNNTDKLHKLASLMIVKNNDELKKKIQWQGAGIESRK